MSVICHVAFPIDTNFQTFLSPLSICLLDPIFLASDWLSLHKACLLIGHLPILPHLSPHLSLWCTQPIYKFPQRNTSEKWNFVNFQQIPLHFPLELTLLSKDSKYGCLRNSIIFNSRSHSKLWTGYDFIWIVTMTDAIRKDLVLHFYQEFYTVLYSQKHCNFSRIFSLWQGDSMFTRPIQNL